MENPSTSTLSPGDQARVHDGADQKSGGTIDLTATPHSPHGMNSTVDKSEARGPPPPLSNTEEGHISFSNNGEIHGQIATGVIDAEKDKNPGKDGGPLTVSRNHLSLRMSASSDDEDGQLVLSMEEEEEHGPDGAREGGILAEEEQGGSQHTPSSGDWRHTKLFQTMSKEGVGSPAGGSDRNSGMTTNKSLRVAFSGKSLTDGIGLEEASAHGESVRSYRVRQIAKVKRFFTTLQGFGNDMSPEVAEQVQELIAALVNGTATIEEFHQEIQVVTNHPLKDFIIPFLRENLDLFREELKESSQALSDVLGGPHPSTTVGMTPQLEEDEIPMLPSAKPGTTPITPLSSSAPPTLLPPASSGTKPLLTASITTPRSHPHPSTRSHPHPSTPSHPHPSTPSHSHPSTPSQHRVSALSNPHPSIPSHPQPSTPSQPLFSATASHHHPSTTHHTLSTTASHHHPITVTRPHTPTTASLIHMDMTGDDYSGAVYSLGTRKRQRRPSLERSLISTDSDSHSLGDTLLYHGRKRPRPSNLIEASIITSPGIQHHHHPPPPPTYHTPHTPSQTSQVDIHSGLTYIPVDQARRSLMAEDWGHVDLMLGSVLGMVERCRQAVSMLKERVVPEIDKKESEVEAVIQLRVQEAVDKLKKQFKDEKQQILMDANKQLRESVVQVRGEMEGRLAQAQAQVVAAREALKETNLQTNSKENCWNCGRRATETCSGCSKARYCGTFCQHKDWGNHMHHCASGLPATASVKQEPSSEISVAMPTTAMVVPGNSNNVIVMPNTSALGPAVIGQPVQFISRSNYPDTRAAS